MIGEALSYLQTHSKTTWVSPSHRSIFGERFPWLKNVYVFCNWNIPHFWLSANDRITGRRTQVSKEMTTSVHRICHQMPQPVQKSEYFIIHFVPKYIVGSQHLTIAQLLEHLLKISGSFDVKLPFMLGMEKIKTPFCHNISDGRRVHFNSKLTP